VAEGGSHEKQTQTRKEVNSKKRKRKVEGRKKE
jgi:hypothetical protein